MNELKAKAFDIIREIELHQAAIQQKKVELAPILEQINELEKEEGNNE